MDGWKEGNNGSEDNPHESEVQLFPIPSTRLHVPSSPLHPRVVPCSMRALRAACCNNQNLHTLKPY